SHQAGAVPAAGAREVRAAVGGVVLHPVGVTDRPGGVAEAVALECHEEGVGARDREIWKVRTASSRAGLYGAVGGDERVNASDHERRRGGAAEAGVRDADRVAE